MPITELQFLQLQLYNELLQFTLSVSQSSRKFLIAILQFFQYQMKKTLRKRKKKKEIYIMNILTAQVELLS